MASKPGNLLADRYQIVTLIGQGAYSAVYQAVDIRLGNRSVAIKEFRLRSGLSAEQVLRESTVLAALAHPNLPRLTDFFQLRDSVYWVTDYVEGQRLEGIVKARGALSEPQVIDYASQVLDALIYIHTRNIIHRDIKPSNIIITTDGRAFLVDFGIASPNEDRNTTRTGTPAYSPIEQYGAHTDARADIYSLGATLYYALTAVVPPPPTDQLIRSRLVIPRELNPSISPHLENVVLRAMALQPNERWQSATQMRQALLGAQTTSPSGPTNSAATVIPIPREGTVPREETVIVRPAPPPSLFAKIKRLFFPDLELIEQRVMEIEQARSLAVISRIGAQSAWLPARLTREAAGLRPIYIITQRVQAAMESETVYNRKSQWQQAHEQAEKTLADLGKPGNPTAARLSKVLERWDRLFKEQLDKLESQRDIPNVYIAGSPLAASSRVFKGRRDLFIKLEQQLATAADQRPTLLLYGGRRIGKTSVIKQMPNRLGPNVIPVEVDLQSAATSQAVTGLLTFMANEIRTAASQRQLDLPLIAPAELENDPYMYFLSWITRVEKLIGDRWMLLNLDEYEYIQNVVINWRDERLLQLLRTLIQHHPRVTVLLSGSHTFSDMDPMWSNYLINVHLLHVDHLQPEEARELITNPVPDFPLKYAQDAIQRIIEVTGCHPYLLQATCRNLVTNLNQQSRLDAKVADVEGALNGVLETAEGYFQDLWMGADTDEAQRQLMSVIAASPDGECPKDQFGLVGSSTGTARKLINRDILVDTGSAYRFRCELLRRWVKLQTSLTH